MTDKRHTPQPELTSWPTRQAMVSRGLTINMPWLAFVHVSFALMILLRNTLVPSFDPAHISGQQIGLLVDAAMLGVIALSAALVVMSWRHITGISLVLFTSGLLWALCCGRSAVTGLSLTGSFLTPGPCVPFCCWPPLPRSISIQWDCSPACCRCG
ncbi:membrane-associated sensor domain-containing protein [Lelliottia nimipressuralis]|uniref:membrane-associated sensor domain-containing protein n=1 Tax=Lelliottia nimipressuralis TaxID=69220 RepID=UPI0039068D9A